MANQRLHSLDALRASMMLLGLVIHCAVSYGVLWAGGPVWPYADPSSSEAFDFIVDFIHLWRMPLFYVIAGFFSSLLLIRRGFGSLAQNRAIRVAVPFVIGWVILLPLIFSGFLFSITAKSASYSEAFAVAWNYLSTGEFQTQATHFWYFYFDSTGHLWFLYYLMMFYLVGMVLHNIAQRLPDRIRSLPLHLFGKIVGSNWNVLLLSVPFAIVLCTMPNGFLQTKNSFIPDWRTFIGYFIFFCFGWLLYLRRELLFSWSRTAWTQVAAGTVLSLVHFAAARTTVVSGETPLTFWATVISGAVAVWLFTFGLIGLCLRYLDRPMPVVRYVVDASYWMYLVHLPLTTWLPGLIAQYDWSPWIKSSLVLLATTVFCLVTYDLFVRNTVIGKVLNGRRYPRGLPTLEMELPAQVPEAVASARRGA